MMEHTEPERKDNQTSMNAHQVETNAKLEVSEKKKHPAPLIKVDSAESINTNALSEDSSSFQVSISSHVSTPFDCILLSQAQDLRADVDNIKMNICSALKVDLDKFALVTPQGIKQCNVLNKFTLATGLLALVNHSEKLCATVSGSRLSEAADKGSDLIPPVSPKLNSFEQTLKSIQASIMELKDDKKHESMFKSIEEKLEGLKVDLSQFNKQCGSDSSTPDGLFGPAPPFAFNMMVNKPPNVKHAVHKADQAQQSQNLATAHIEQYVENFIGPDRLSQLSEFLEQHDSSFSQNSESGHDVLSFGESYNYTGAKAVAPHSKEFPEVIQSLVSDIKKSHPAAVINQCLINRYADQSASLPKHSDDEDSIVHDSRIFTVSVGAPCDVVFSRADTPAEEKVETIEGNSLYVMSKQSQFVWQHRIDPSSETRALRYSITFRYISKNSANATIIVGDSNTRHLKFGSGKKTFGDRIPGKRVEAFLIDQIDPYQCEGYSNVFIHCGINNIKKSGSVVEECVDKLASKLDKICELCPYSKVTVSPILPTKLSWLNARALHFNQLLFRYCDGNPRIGTLDFNSFVGSDSLLDSALGRYQDQTDAIHLGSTGIFRLSRLIANKLLSNPTDGRLYSQAAASKVGTGSNTSQFQPRRRRSVILPP